MPRLASLIPLVLATLLRACSGNGDSDGATSGGGDASSATPQPTAAGSTATPRIEPTSTRPAPTPQPTRELPRYFIHDIQTNRLITPEDAGYKATLALIQGIGSPSSHSGSVASPDGAYVAVYEDGLDAADQFAVILQRDSGDELWRVEDGRFNGSNRPLEAWSADSTRILMVLGVCTADERLIVFDVRGGSENVLFNTSGDLFSFVYSPDSRWVAVTYGSGGGIVPADGSGAVIQVVAENVHAPADPIWSEDSRYVAFWEYFGGYGKCA